MVSLMAIIAYALGDFNEHPWSVKQECAVIISIYQQWRIPMFFLFFKLSSLYGFWCMIYSV